MTAPDLDLQTLPPRTLIEWCHAAYENSKAHGFHDVPNDGQPSRIPVRVALLHSEVSELLDAFRKDPSAPCDKPGVNLSRAAEELADITIRLFDFMLEFGVSPESHFDRDFTFQDARRHSNFIDDPDTFLLICRMHAHIGRLLRHPHSESYNLFCLVVHFAAVHGYDLELAVQTKHAYNVTRPHMHGGKF